MESNRLWIGFLLAIGATCALPMVTAVAQYGGGWGGYSSTAGEGYARGMADVVRSAGAANLMNSVAAGKYEDARAKAMDNRVKNASTYFEARAINRAAREAESTPPLTSEQLFRIAHRGVPRPLTTEEYDPLTGTITWPLVLREDSYANYRLNVEELCSSRKREGRDFTYQTAAELQQAIDAWNELLSSRVKEYRSQDFMDARRFLESLAYQARRGL